MHVDYDEFYTLPRGRVLLGLADIRRTSPTFRHFAQFAWADRDNFAVVIPRGVAHVVLFEEDSVLTFGLSSHYDPKYDVVGCQWDDPELGFKWPTQPAHISERDSHSGDYRSMLRRYEELQREWSERKAVEHSTV